MKQCIVLEQKILNTIYKYISIFFLLTAVFKVSLYCVDDPSP